MHRKSKETVKEEPTYLLDHPATLKVTEITRRRYNKPTWYGYGITFTVNFDSQDDFTYRETVEKSRLNRNPIQRFLDHVFNRSPPTSLTDVIIEVSRNAEDALNEQYQSQSLTAEEQVDSALAALN